MPGQGCEGYNGSATGPTKINNNQKIKGSKEDGSNSNGKVNGKITVTAMAMATALAMPIAMAMATV
jgi:hypothetical protein